MPDTKEMQPWFAARRHGYGAGLPIAWQGWAVLGSYLSLVGFVSFLNRLPGGGPRITAFVLLIGGTATFLSIVKQRTHGGWRWRWDKKD
ncbi:MAG TPA: hypothetical protein PKJ55_09450 [Novosphingobium sp.]|nr:hypothetical protein [Novosphingobium sp.]HPZ46467.1 hypothetical protein [Novosphingobium sp.]HQD99328.1 hypothetical protein [Novosphingobium sp.]